MGSSPWPDHAPCAPERLLEASRYAPASRRRSRIGLIVCQVDRLSLALARQLQQGCDVTVAVRPRMALPCPCGAADNNPCSAENAARLSGLLTVALDDLIAPSLSRHGGFGSDLDPCVGLGALG